MPQISVCLKFYIKINLHILLERSYGVITLTDIFKVFPLQFFWAFHFWLSKMDVLALSLLIYMYKWSWVKWYHRSSIIVRCFVNFFISVRSCVLAFSSIECDKLLFSGRQEINSHSDLTFQNSSYFFSDKSGFSLLEILIGTEKLYINFFQWW